MAARILVDDKGLANGVQYFDRYSKGDHKIYAKRVIVAASCVDSTRILLNSMSSLYPNGLGNSSDVIGRYLSEQISFTMRGFAPELLGGKVYNDDGIGGAHMYMPRFNHRDGRKFSGDYLRAVLAVSSGTIRARRPIFLYAKNIPGFGLEFKKTVKQRYPVRCLRCTRLARPFQKLRIGSR